MKKILDPIFVTDFNDDAVIKFKDQVLEHLANYPSDPIVIYINSYGGEIEGLAAMVEIINSIDNEVHTIVTGKAYSAAAILLTFGDVRYCGKHGTIMVHEVSSGMFGNASDMENNLKEVKRQNTYWLKQLSNNSKIELKDLRDMLKESTDLYLPSKKAKNLGIVDHVGFPKTVVKFKHIESDVKPIENKNIEVIFDD